MLYPSISINSYRVTPEKGTQHKPVFFAAQWVDCFAMDESRADKNGTRISSKGNKFDILKDMFYVDNVEALKCRAQKSVETAAQCAARCSTPKPLKTMDKSRREFMFENEIPSEWEIWNSPARGSPSKWAESFAMGSCAMEGGKGLSLETLFGETLVASWAEENKESEANGGEEAEDTHGGTTSGGSFTMGNCAMDGSLTEEVQFGDVPSAAWTAMQRNRAEARRTNAAAVKKYRRSGWKVFWSNIAITHWPWRTRTRRKGSGTSKIKVSQIHWKDSRYLSLMRRP